MSITPKENLKRLVTGSSAEWLPVTLDVGAVPGFTKPMRRLFEEKTGEKDPAEYFDYDFRTVSLATRFGGDHPASLHRHVKSGTTFDEWGVGHWAGGAEATYEETLPPLAEADDVTRVEALPVPVIEPGETAMTVRAYHQRGYPVFGYAGSVYEWSWWLRGMEQFMTDLLTNPLLAEAILEKVSSHTARLALASAAAGIDVLCFYDDAGMQTGLQIAPELWRRFIKPRWREVLAQTRKAYPDSIFFLHSCGKIDAIVPDVIELGFHILHPIQPECMDFASLHRDVGRDIVLCATISAQRLFPFGSPAEITRWVENVRRSCHPHNHAILCPSNLIQPETPWENILAFVEAARRA